MSRTVHADDIITVELGKEYQEHLGLVDTELPSWIYRRISIKEESMGRKWKTFRVPEGWVALKVFVDCHGLTDQEAIRRITDIDDTIEFAPYDATIIGNLTYVYYAGTPMSEVQRLQALYSRKPVKIRVLKQRTQQIKVEWLT